MLNVRHLRREGRVPTAQDVMYLPWIPELLDSVLDWLHALDLGWWVVGREVNDVARASG